MNVNQSFFTLPSDFKLVAVTLVHLCIKFTIFTHITLPRLLQPYNSHRGAQSCSRFCINTHLRVNLRESDRLYSATRLNHIHNTLTDFSAPLSQVWEKARVYEI